MVKGLLLLLSVGALTVNAQTFYDDGTSGPTLSTACHARQKFIGATRQIIGYAWLA